LFPEDEDRDFSAGVYPPVARRIYRLWITKIGDCP